MRAYRFSLRQVLAWRRTQLEVEENRTRQIAAALEELRLEVIRRDLARSRAEQSVRETHAMDAGDLWALAAYRGRLLAECQALAERRQSGEQQLAAQKRKMLEAQRQCRLLEKLEERRRAEWQSAADREAETLAAESFLAVWNRRAD